MRQKKLSQKFSQQLLNQLAKKQDEVVEIKPQSLGVLTPAYKSATHYLKDSPWKILIPVSLFLAVVGIKLLGPVAIRLVSVLQKAF